MLSHEKMVMVQWIPSHCGLLENEGADRLAKSGGRQPQQQDPISHSEAKTIKTNTGSYGLTCTTYHPVGKIVVPQANHIVRLHMGQCQL